MNIAEIGVLASSLKSAGDLVATMVGLRDSTKIQEAARELNTIILAAQRSALEAQSSQLSLLKQVGELEKEVVAVKKWDAEQQRYELKDMGGRALVYAIKPSMRGTEPPHAICTNCYEHGKKSILQFNGASTMGEQSYDCSSCKTRFHVNQRFMMDFFSEFAATS